MNFLRNAADKARNAADKANSLLKELDEGEDENVDLGIDAEKAQEMLQKTKDQTAKLMSWTGARTGGLLRAGAGAGDLLRKGANKLKEELDAVKREGEFEDYGEDEVDDGTSQDSHGDPDEPEESAGVASAGGDGWDQDDAFDGLDDDVSVATAEKESAAEKAAAEKAAEKKAVATEKAAAERTAKEQAEAETTAAEEAAREKAAAEKVASDKAAKEKVAAEKAAAEKAARERAAAEKAAVERAAKEKAAAEKAAAEKAAKEKAALEKAAADKAAKEKAALEKAAADKAAKEKAALEKAAAEKAAAEKVAGENAAKEEAGTAVAEKVATTKALQEDIRLDWGEECDSPSKSYESEAGVVKAVTSGQQLDTSALEELKLQANENQQLSSEVARLKSELGVRESTIANTQDILQQREAKLAELSQHLLDLEARFEVERDELVKECETQHQEYLTQLQERHRQELESKGRSRTEAQMELGKAEDKIRSLEKNVQKMQTERDKANAKAAAADEAAEKAEKRAKDDEQQTEKELKELQDRYKKKFTQMEEDKKAAEKQLKVVNAEKSEVQRQLERLQKKEEDLEADEKDLQAEYEEELEKIDQEREAAEARFEADVQNFQEIETQLRRELQAMDGQRAQLEERCAEMSRQLENAQAAYGEAVAEISAMTTRLHELEWGSQTESNSEELLRHELECVKERQVDTEKRLNEVTWMRDYALQQAEEVRGQLAQQKDEVERLQKNLDEAQAEQADGKTSGNTGNAREAAQSKELEDRLAQIQDLHRAEVEQDRATFREEIAYLKKKNEEKDKRLEILTCERNALRYEASQQSDSVPNRGKNKRAGDVNDLEEGLPSAGISSSISKNQWEKIAKDADRALRGFSRILFVSPTMRRVFYGYFIIMHIWVWIVLHHHAAQHSAGSYHDEEKESVRVNFAKAVTTTLFPQ